MASRGMTLVGLPALRKQFDAYIKRNEKRIVDLRKQVARDLVEALVANVPVWSGRSVRSISVENSATGGNTTEVHPDRRNTAKDGKWKSHKGEWGDTRTMPLGAEPQRGAAEAIALASVEAVDYSLGAQVFITSSSYNWGDVDSATYRSDARNKAVVSDIAVAQIRAKYGKLLK